jgi:hypothetical protein
MNGSDFRTLVAVSSILGTEAIALSMVMKVVLGVVENKFQHKHFGRFLQEYLASSCRSIDHTQVCSRLKVHEARQRITYKSNSGPLLYVEGCFHGANARRIISCGIKTAA